MIISVLTIYGISIFGFYLLTFVLNKKMYKAKIGETLLMYLLSPVLFIYLAYQAINIKLIYRNRPRPLTGKLKSLLIGSVLDKDNNIVSLKEYNLKNNTSFTMEDVYGKKFMNSLSEEDRERLKEREEEEIVLEKEYNTIEFEEGLEDDIYTEVCKAFVKARDEDRWDEFEKYLADDVILINYNKKRLDGKTDFIEYWRELWQRAAKDKVYYKTTVKYCVYDKHSAVFDRPKGYKDMYVFFRIENGKITHAAYTPQTLQKSSLIRYCDLDHDMSSFVDIDDFFMSKEIEAKPLRLPCLSCGTLSENLIWYFYNDVRHADLSYAGETSICFYCNRVVEFCPSTMSRIMRQYNSQDLDSDLEDLISREELDL